MGEALRETNWIEGSRWDPPKPSPHENLQKKVKELSRDPRQLEELLRYIRKHRVEVDDKDELWGAIATDFLEMGMEEEGWEKMLTRVKQLPDDRLTAGDLARSLVDSQNWPKFGWNERVLRNRFRKLVDAIPANARQDWVPRSINHVERKKFTSQR